MEKAKQELTSELDELKGQEWSKDQQLEESRIHLLELEKAHSNSSKMISKLKADVKHVER